MLALLIDLFGTLIKEGNDEIVHKEISKDLSKLVNGLNWQEHFNLYKDLVSEGLGSGEAVWEALVRISERRGLKLSLQKNMVYEMHMRYHAKLAELYEDSIEALELGKKLFGKIALVSDSDAGVAEEILKAKGIRHYFDAIVVSGEVGVRKPDPRLFLEAARRVKADPNKCVMTGDTIKDVEGAKAAGMKAVLLARSVKEISQSSLKPDAIAYSLTEAIKVAYELIP